MDRQPENMIPVATAITGMDALKYYYYPGDDDPRLREIGFNLSMNNAT